MSVSNLEFTGGPCLRLSFIVLHRDKQSKGRSQRPCLSMAFYVLKQRESETEIFRIERPRSSEMLLTLK